MLNTTFAKAHDAKACVESYHKMGDALGGIKAYGKDTPIPLSKVLEVCGLQDAIWALRCTVEPSENIIIEFACRCAEHVLRFYTDKYPGDNRPQQAIDAARRCLNDKSTAARSAAWSADSAAMSAADAAWSAANSAVDSVWSAAESAADAAWSAANSAVDSVWSAAELAADAAMSAADSAARAAAWSADSAWSVWSAARAAWSAESARSDEIKWQSKTLMEMLNGNRF